MWILLLEATGSVRSQVRITAGDGGFGGSLDYLDFFGRSVECIGDVDGDGVVDLAVGAIKDDDGVGPGNTDLGAVWILFLDSDGTVVAEQEISATEGGLRPPMFESSDRFFGDALASMGDLDGDGVPDLGVGASHDDQDCFQCGSYSILLLRPDGTVRNQWRIGHPQDDADTGFGISADALGDLNGDSRLDLVVGEYGDAAGRGAVWILFLGGQPLALVPDQEGTGHEAPRRSRAGFPGRPRHDGPGTEH